MRSWFESEDPLTGEVVVLAEFRGHLPLHEWVMVHWVRGDTTQGDRVPPEGVVLSEDDACMFCNEMHGGGVPVLSPRVRGSYFMVPEWLQREVIGRYVGPLARCSVSVLEEQELGRTVRYRYSGWDGVD